VDGWEEGGEGEDVVVSSGDMGLLCVRVLWKFLFLWKFCVERDIAISRPF
jgi:hypothetical protein